jgi:hypothetical protein
MRKYKLSIILIICSVSINAQHLNKLGKIDTDEIPSMPEFRIEKINGDFKVIKDSLQLDGNTFFSVTNGYITSLQVVDDEKDYIKHYGLDGKLLVTILSDKIINLKVSDKGNKLAFYNSKNIISIDLQGYNIDTLADSYIYEFVEQEHLIYYHPDDKCIYYKNLTIDCTQYPNQFLEYNGKVLVITKQYIYELKGNSLLAKHEFEGKFFDARIIDDDFYFVDKEQKRKSESFSLYKTSDFNQFVLVDRLDDLNR